MDSYQKILAESILTEDKVVTYRLLSRTLRVHPNTAKQMLYDFHRTQNARRPGAVHATYLVHGVKQAAEHVNGGDGDVEMKNSTADTDSIAESIPIFTIALVPEDQLQDQLAQYDEVSSIHVYSVGPNPLKDIALLADVAQEALNLGPADEKKSTAIVNSGVRRRERKGAPRPAPKAAPAPASKSAPAPAPKAAAAPPASKAVPPATKQTSKEARDSFFKNSSASSNAKEGGTSTSASKNTETPAASAAAKKTPATLKRVGSANSSIARAFGKAASMPKKTKLATSNPATPSGDDSSMQALSDDGEDDEVIPQPPARGATSQKSKQGREDKGQVERKLREMMDEEERLENMEKQAKGEDSKGESDEEASSDEEPMPEPPAPEPVKEEPAEVVSVSQGGRRRGKRRVMRKKVVVDDAGQLVTTMEQGWESFSEDDAPPATKPKTTSSAQAASTAKTAKKSGVKGQGSIMNFFAKK